MICAVIHNNVRVLYFIQKLVFVFSFIFLFKDKYLYLFNFRINILDNVDTLHFKSLSSVGKEKRN